MERTVGDGVQGGRRDPRGVETGEGAHDGDGVEKRPGCRGPRGAMAGECVVAWAVGLEMRMARGQEPVRE